MPNESRNIAEALVTSIRDHLAKWDNLGRWVIIFPDSTSSFELQGEGVRLIVDIGIALDKTGLSQMVARWSGAPLQIRLRTWYLNEFVERMTGERQEAVRIIFSILEAHKPSGRKAPRTVSGAPEMDDPDRPSLGADD